jgi:predicted porin
MNKSSRHLRLYTGVSLSALVLVLGASGSAIAQSVSDAQVKALLTRIEQLERTVNDLKHGQAESTAEAKAALKQANQAKAQAAQAQAPRAEVDQNGHTYLQHKTGNPLTFYTPGGEITAYGNIDVSIDDTSKDTRHLNLNGGAPPIGNFGWMPAISTNLSYVGVRGFQRIPEQPFNFVYQLEAGFDVSAFPGNRQSNSNLSNQVNGALFSRNSFIGLASPDWGAVKIGKTDAPYKNSTAMFNPFSGMIGDYAVVMGNSGGDNRVEFGTRLSHAIWYESPKVGGFQFNALFAPGQNRAQDSSNLAAGESDCAGGNDPTSGGNLPVACNDGAFSDVVSANLSYTNGPLYATASYEFHRKVNRQSDITAIYGPALPGVSANLFIQDVANEDAYKFGVLYKFPTETTIGAIFESMHRHVAPDLEFQNERTRNGTWVFLSQQLTKVDSLHFGWAHAFRTPGDPGQHNDSTVPTPDGLSFVASNDNAANMYTAAWKRQLSENLTWYLAVAATVNGPSAHYDLGAGGRGVTTDCHDASDASGGAASAPHCFTGTTLMGVSTGAKWTF